MPAGLRSASHSAVRPHLRRCGHGSLRRSMLCMRHPRLRMRSRPGNPHAPDGRPPPSSNASTRRESRASACCSGRSTRSSRRRSSRREISHVPANPSRSPSERPHTAMPSAGGSPSSTPDWPAPTLLHPCSTRSRTIRAAEPRRGLHRRYRRRARRAEGSVRRRRQGSLTAKPGAASTQETWPELPPGRAGPSSTRETRRWDSTSSLRVPAATIEPRSSSGSSNSPVSVSIQSSCCRWQTTPLRTGIQAQESGSSHATGTNWSERHQPHSGAPLIASLRQPGPT
jgi:hypothetical protein